MTTARKARKAARPAARKVTMGWVPVGRITVMDGDTFRVDFMASELQGPKRVGLYFADVVVRLARIQCPELRTGEPGRKAAAALQAWVDRHTRKADVRHDGLRIITEGDAHDHFGERTGAELVAVATGEAVSDHLLGGGFAVPYRR